ncbi:succinylglutamate desuccinylase/aspartoacylase family protein [Thalassomonas viridans]|uniref:Succinylglutamate desuccinylase/aspartoacylase family protein n=1 Tax=Thalassomonas viridans TaxID=137584 RepID=A0AAE9YYU2_9GAMM|nr:M14 family metallopeptidase [Thalassomonas viridans]WDE02930.1 succinylglutamate desuccinylase/aspartoacylase family protein [Thalassomonas viridans]
MFRFFNFCLLLLISSYGYACKFSNVEFATDFSGGRLAQCQQLSGNKFLLTFNPENTPINDSPWYSFKVTAKQPQTVSIVMEVNDGKHRYQPKVSRDGKHWQKQSFTLDNSKMLLSLSADSQPTWVSGQEVISNVDYYLWGKSLADANIVEQEVIGHSVQERPIYSLAARAGGNEWLVILGRQHPPEITGALAMFPFTETLLGASPLALKFRERFNILVVPDLNPDGVYHGNWRHNVNGVDLNRDWKHFKQPETAAVNDYLTALVAQKQKIAMAVDFHSTHKDIFYSMPHDYGVENPQLVNNWLEALQLAIVNEYPDFQVVQKPGNNPDRGVFKQYIADKFKVHAITYEMGDETDRVFIDKLAVKAANTLMTTMLATQEQN